MRPKQSRFVVVLVLIGIGSGSCVWHTFAAVFSDTGADQAGSGQAVGTTGGAPPGSPSKAPATVARLTGTVKLDGTGQPIAGAKLQILSGFVMGLAMGKLGEKIVETGADGQFSADLPAGNTRVLLSDLPAGYLVLSMQEAIEDLVVKPDQPVIHQEFRVRQGTVWNFQLTRGSDQRPFPGIVHANPTVAGAAPSRAQADDRGRAGLTLPSEGRTATLGVRESALPASGGLPTGVLQLGLEWEPGFQPGELEDISQVQGPDRRFRLIDANAKAAILRAPAPIEPVKENGGLLIRVAIPYRDAKDFAALTGQVLEEQGRPLAGAHVALVSAPGFFRMPDELQYATTTDPQGRYRLREVPSRAIDGKPLEVMLMVTKEGYASLQSPRLILTEGDTVQPRIVDPIRLVRGVSLSGVVVDHRGRPVAGVLVLSNQRNTPAGPSGVPASATTDGKGRFTIRGLLRGAAIISAFDEKVRATNGYLVDGSTEEVRIKLPERMEQPGANIGALLQPPPPPVAVRQRAPELRVGPWSDGRARKLGDLRGKVIVLYFWRIEFPPSVSSLPALGELATQFQARGVEFLIIHHAEPDEEAAQEQGRKVLASKGAPLALAIDQTRIPKHALGSTAWNYGLQPGLPPVIVVIDRAGKIAFRSDTATGAGSLSAAFMQMRQNSGNLTQEKAIELIDRTLAGEIEKALQQKN